MKVLFCDNKMPSSKLMGGGALKSGEVRLIKTAEALYLYTLFYYNKD